MLCKSTVNIKKGYLANSFDSFQYWRHYHYHPFSLARASQVSLLVKISSDYVK